MSGTALQAVASRLSVSQADLQSIVMNTLMPNKGEGVTNEQFTSFIAIANEYKLNPLVKEIYAFPAKSGGIQPIVSIDGWLRIITSNKNFDGMEHNDVRENGNLVAVECKIYRKDTSHPVTVTEYMDECRRGTDPWKKWPSRMLRHKATIQAARYAFGISGIIDPDEADRFKDSGVIVDVEATKELPGYPDEKFKENFLQWKDLIEGGKKTPGQIIATLESRFTLSGEQRDAIAGITDSGEDNADM